MANLEYKTLSFEKEDNHLKVTLLRQFSVKIPLTELKQIGESIISKNSIEFPKLEQDKAETKFSFLLAKYMPNLTNKLTGNKVTYIHQNSGIPLIGNVSFGIVYRNSSIIEIKPVTSCNLNCLYCSISEGLESKKHDFVVEKDYLVNELIALLKFVEEKVEIHIGVQGEPLLYADMEELIKDLQSLDQIKTISIDTNATLLSKERIDRLAENNKLQINFSLDAINPEIAKKIAGVEHYKVKHVKEMIAYASKKLKVIIAPVLTLGYNDDEIEEIVKWVKTLPKQPILGIQNFLRYKTGKNPAQELSWEKFYKLIANLEKKYKIKLKLNREDFNIHKTRELPKPFREGDPVKAIIKCPDRFPNTIIAAAKGRNISIPDCKFQPEKKINIRIVRDKHNVFVGKLI